ncbi:MAG: hypothetical protein G01um101431_2 [Parcubacteria group bacterium Gr01-1014_31]|nr:MAG: hypothetical protein G01um101431_2 [Parcubacteria group bacterium Gr01-1014_31]
MMEQVPSKSAFWFGYAGGALSVMALGFVISLPLLLKGAGIVGGGDDDVVAAKPSAGGQVAGAQLPSANDPTEPRSARSASVSTGPWDK